MVMLLYLFLLIRAGIIYRRCQLFFPKLLLMGVTLLIVYQALMSMAVGVGIFVTGQPLPLISRGGTSIMLTCIYFGVILSVSRINGDDEESDFRDFTQLGTNQIAIPEEVTDPSDTENDIPNESPEVEEKEMYPY